MEELATAQMQLWDIQGRIKGEEDMRQKCHVTFEQRIRNVETLVHDSAQKGTTELEVKLRDFYGLLSNEKDMRETDQATMEQHVRALEKRVGDAGEKHAK